MIWERSSAAPAPRRCILPCVMRPLPMRGCRPPTRPSADYRRRCCRRAPGAQAGRRRASWSIQIICGASVNFGCRCIYGVRWCAVPPSQRRQAHLGRTMTISGAHGPSVRSPAQPSRARTCSPCPEPEPIRHIVQLVQCYIRPRHLQPQAQAT